MDSTIEQLLARGQAAGLSSSTGALLSAPEAERIIEQLSAYGIEQAHHNAQTHSDEFIVELLVTCDKLNVLVHELLAIEVALFHEHACQAASEDSLLELADWCYRKLQYLNTDAYKAAAVKERTVEQLMGTSATEDLDEKSGEVDFGTSLAALTIVRYLSDYLPRLPMGVLGRMVGTNDTIMALLPLMENPPWVRRRKGKVEKYIGNQWKAVDAGDRLKLSQCDIQAWLALNNLLVEPRCRAKYDVDDYRKEALLRLRRYMNELLFDQLPVLKDLQRVLDELALNVAPNTAESKSSRLILEQVPEIRDHILRGKNWKAIADKQRQEQFGEGARHMAQDRIEALRKAFEFMVDLEEGPEAAQANGTASTSGSRDPVSAPVKINCWRKVTDKAEDGVWASWCDFAMNLAADKPPEPVTLSVDGASVAGLRYRLMPLEMEATRPFPTNGKVVVLHMGRSAEALLQLPVVPVRQSSEGPALLWLTVGLLATDGFALQLKLKKADKPVERDKVEGSWFAYHAIGGAITVLREDQSGLTDVS